MRITTCFVLILGLVLFVFQAVVVAQTTGNAPPQIKTSITIESTTLARGKPAIVTITVENISGKELELTPSCSFDLANLSKETLTRKYERVGDRYWGPVTISNSTPTKLDIIDPEKLKQGIVVGRVPKDSLQFAKDETKSFKVDLTTLFWNDSMLSTWPHETLFQVVPKGSYALSFALSTDRATVESNAIEVSVK